MIDKLVGRVPTAENVYGAVPPEAVTVNEYAVPITALGGWALVSTSAGAEPVTVIVRLLDTDCGGVLLSVSPTVNGVL